MIGLYLFFKAFIWCMKVLALVTAAMVAVAVTVVGYLALGLVVLIAHIVDKRKKIAHD